MISDVGLDRCPHSYNGPNIYGLGLSEDSMNRIDIDNEHKILHLRHYIGSVSLV